MENLKIVDKNEIKKALYKNKPNAFLESVNKTGLLYYAGWGGSSLDGVNDTVVYFKVPLEDVGDATFHRVMEAQLLIRYLI